MIPNRTSTVAVILWGVFAFTAWNAVFDYTVTAATWRYIRLQGAHLAGDGPPVRMQDIMSDGIRQGLRRASMVGGVIVAIGIAGVVVARRREDGR